MTRHWKLVAIATAIVVGAMSAAVASEQTSAADKEVLQAMYALAAAADKKDKATLERLYADDYIFHASNGTTVAGKAATIADDLSSDTQWTGRKYDNLKVRIYGDVAVITGSLTLTGSSTRYRTGARHFTDIWVRRDGRWLNVGGQTTLVPGK